MGGYFTGARKENLLRFQEKPADLLKNPVYKHKPAVPGKKAAGKATSFIYPAI
jgi:hypothetical protein